MTSHKHGAENVRHFLDLSTAHLPEALREDRGLWGDSGLVVVRELEYGFWLWVPETQISIEDYAEGTLHQTVVAIWDRARELGCDYVLFDADGPIDEELPTYEEGESSPPYDAATATGMYDREEG